MRGPLVAPHVKQRNLIDVSIFLRKIEQQVVEHSKQQVIAIASADVPTYTPHLCIHTFAFYRNPYTTVGRSGQTLIWYVIRLII